MPRSMIRKIGYAKRALMKELDRIARNMHGIERKEKYGIGRDVLWNRDRLGDREQKSIYPYSSLCYIL